ncbi:MAG: biopolymer transporter ExbD [Armatimonadota bacterium]|nr:MAG: biopolymer transporter ExbD [Armatimonadota bacterium]
MRLPRQGYKRARLEIIPMIDTIFFLLVFFMVASLSMTLQNGMPVNLPKAEAAEREALTKVTVSLTQDGKLYLDKEQTTIDALGPALAQRISDNPRVVVVINADDRVEHGRVVAAMDAAKKAGAARMAIATQPG